MHFTTKNAVGKTINLNLFEEEKFNFKYNGKKLPNNTLKDYKITNDTEIVTLEVVENENITY